MKAIADTVQGLFQHPRDTISLRIPSCDRFITLTKRGLQRVWYSVSSLKFQYRLFSLWKPSMCLSFLRLFFFLSFFKNFSGQPDFKPLQIISFFLVVYYVFNANSSSSNCIFHCGLMIGENFLRTREVLVATHVIWIPQFTCKFREKKQIPSLKVRLRTHIVTQVLLKYERALAIALRCSVIARINVTVHPWQRWMDLSH